MAWLTDPRYWQGHRNDLLAFLELIADPRIVSLLSNLGGEPPLFLNTQYFAEPVSRNWNGLWHRDTQFLDWADDAERARMAAFTGVHFRIAFIDDDNLEIVPGSQNHFDSDAERAIRKAPDESTRRNAAMPDAARIVLQPGDALLFHAWSIHRGRYRADRPRRTLDLIYQWGGVLADHPPPPTCFTDPTILAALSPGARDVFDRFIAAYNPYW